MERFLSSGPRSLCPHFPGGPALLAGTQRGGDGPYAFPDAAMESTRPRVSELFCPWSGGKTLTHVARRKAEVTRDSVARAGVGAVSRHAASALASSRALRLRGFPVSTSRACSLPAAVWAPRAPQQVPLLTSRVAVVARTALCVPKGHEMHP